MTSVFKNSIHDVLIFLFIRGHSRKWKRAVLFDLNVSLMFDSKQSCVLSRVRTVTQHLKIT